MRSSKPVNAQKVIIIHVLNGLAVGGIENLCLQLLQHSPAYVQNILVNIAPERLEMLPLFKQVSNLVIVDHHYHTNQRVKFVWSLVKVLIKFQPQAILIYPFGVHVFVGLAARLAQVPSIAATIQNSLPDQPSMQRKWKTIVVISRLLGIPIHPCSHAVEQSLEGLVKLPRGSFPIGNGCDVTAIAKQSHLSRQKRPTTSFQIIGMVARLNSIKDHQTLIQAFAAVNSKFPHTQLWLVGDGEEKQRLQNLTHELNLQKSVIFWGNRSDIPELLGQMDIYAFSTTVNEGFGIALAEAMAASLPVVASDIPACREVLGNGEAGLLIPARDSTALAQALAKLVADAEARTHWGKRAYEYAIANHNIEQCAETWYQLLLNNNA